MEAPIRVGQELRVVQALRLLGTERAVGIRRQDRDTVIKLVVLEHVVVVGEEERRRRSQCGCRRVPGSLTRLKPESSHCHAIFFSVPVLSVRITVIAPRVSTADSRSMSAF